MIFAGGGSRSSGNNDWSTSTPLNTDWPIDEVFAHFVTQMEEQGWVADAEVTGSQMAMGSWTKTVEGGLELIGNINVIETAEDTYELDLRLVGKSQQGGNVGRGFLDNAPAPTIRNSP
jgi:hypothetical protein